MEQSRFDVPYSDEWWFKRLFDAFFEVEKRRDGRKLTRVEWLQYLWGWYEGNPELPQYQQGWQADVTKDVLRQGRANFAMLAVESKLDRLELQSFRAVHDDDTEPDSDKESSVDVKTRRMMAKYQTVFDDALRYASVMGEGYIWVGKPDDDGLPTVTAEDPRSCVSISDPLDDNKALAAMKIYHHTLDGFDYAHIVLPADEKAGTKVRVRVAKRKTTLNRLSARFSPASWEWDDSLSGDLPIQNRGILVHRITALNGMGDFEPFIDLLERINNMIVDRLWISKFQAFRQRALVDKSTDPEDDYEGSEAPADDEDETDWDEVLAADPGALWKLPRAYEIWESTPVDLQGALLAARDDIKEFAAVSRTPLYVFTPEATEGSAEGAALARESQVFKVEKWQKRCRRAFTSVARDMLAVAGEDVKEIELQWSPADRVTMGQRGLASQAAKNSGVPEEGIWETFWQMDPETVKRWKRMRRQQLLFAPQQQAQPFAAQQRPADQQVEPQDLTAFDERNPRKPPTTEELLRDGNARSA